jgi:hypothetical protein
MYKYCNDVNFFRAEWVERRKITLYDKACKNVLTNCIIIVYIIDTQNKSQIHIIGLRDLCNDKNRCAG